jgi:hypothetical protein
VLLCAGTKLEELCLGTKSSRKAAEAPESANLAALAKLTIASYETLERDLRARIATLEGQALRFETAIDNVRRASAFSMPMSG